VGKSKPKSFDEISGGNRPIEGVGTSDPGGVGPEPETPVWVVVVLVIVAIGTFGLLARKARAARQGGAESLTQGGRPRSVAHAEVIPGSSGLTLLGRQWKCDGLL
jgi:hypothetical protein